MIPDNLSPDHFEEYLKVVKSKKTAMTYARAARKLLAWAKASSVSFESANPGMLDNFVRWMVEHENLAPASVKLMVAGARRYLRWLRKNGLGIPDFDSPDLPKVQHENPLVLSERSLGHYLYAATQAQEPARTAMLLLAATGMRSEEVTALELRDMLVEDHGGPRVIFKVLGKGGKVRYVPLHSGFVPYVSDFLRGWRNDKRHLDEKAKRPPNPYFFATHQGSHLQTRTLRNHLVQVRAYLGITELTSHVLRKTFATMLDQAGVSPFVTGQLLGHVRPPTLPSELTTTAKHYVHHGLAELIQAVEKIPFPFPGGT